MASRKLPSVETEQATRSGRPPEGRRVRVRFTDPAFDDLRVMARSDAEVYDEMLQRANVLGRDPHTMPLADAIDALGKLAHGLETQPEPDDELPQWLVGVLTNVVGMPAAEVRHLSATEAQSIWDSYKGRPR